MIFRGSRKKTDWELLNYVFELQVSVLDKNLSLLNCPQNVFKKWSHIIFKKSINLKKVHFLMVAIWYILCSLI